MEAIGYKTKAYKDQNYQLAIKQEPEPENCDIKMNVLHQAGFEKAHRLLLEFLSGKIYPGILIQDLNEIRRHFFE